jgi:hypothetical protein
VPSMSISIASNEAAQAADELQAAYFRVSLVNERDQLAAHVEKQQAEIARRNHLGSSSALRRLRLQVRIVEAELRYVDGLIQRLDRRFARQAVDQLSG